MSHKKYRGISSHLLYTIGTCYLAMDKNSKAAKFFNLSIKTDIPFSSLYYNASSLLDKEEMNSCSYKALYKCLKRRIENKTDCIWTRLKFASVNVEINNFREAKEVLNYFN